MLAPIEVSSLSQFLGVKSVRWGQTLFSVYSQFVAC